MQNMGRLNFSPYLGEFKGIRGAVYEGGTIEDLRGGWLDENSGEAHLGQVCKLQSGTVLRRKFTLSGKNRAVLVGALINGLKINGRSLDQKGYQDGFQFQSIDISAYVNEGWNEIEISYENSPIDRLELIAYSSNAELTNWRIHNVEEMRRVPAQEGTSLVGPSWHTLYFPKPNFPENVHAKLKLRLTGMSKGHVKLNGRDLGRYWQIGPQEDYKIPLSWLMDINELELFDEEGRSTEKVRLIYDNDSFRNWISIG